MFVIIFSVVIVLLLISFFFLNYWYQFGGKVTPDDKDNYLKRANNYKDGKFFNENEFKKIYKNPGKNRFVSKKRTIPIDDIPVESVVFEEYDEKTLAITWLGHSSVFMRMHEMNILIDPVFNNHTAPVFFIGPSRFSKIPVDSEELTKIDIVVISHDHYDHLDYKTIKEIDKKVSKYIVPLGVEKHLERWGVEKKKIINMAWWEEININGLVIGCTPARHYSSRNFIFDSFNTLWASWVFIDKYHKVFESGDTGFDTHFDRIYDKYGDFDLAMLDCGQYDVKWKSTHMKPEDAVKAGMMLHSKKVMPIHYGAFKLANHPWDDGVERFTKEADKLNIEYLTPKIGESIIYDKKIVCKKWWKNIR